MIAVDTSASGNTLLASARSIISMILQGSYQEKDDRPATYPDGLHADTERFAGHKTTQRTKQIDYRVQVAINLALTSPILAG